MIASKVMGGISELPVTLGQRVKSGDLLVKIFSADLAARVTLARTQLSVARRDLEREENLLAKGARTSETVRNLKDHVTTSEAMLRDAEVQLGYAELRAPFDGVVARRLVNAGELAESGQPLIELEGAADFEVEASIPDSLIAPLAPGATLTCEAAGAVFVGTLREISSSADTATRTVGVKIAVPDGTRVRSGQFVRVRVPGTSVRTLRIPAAAVSVSGQMERVFVVGENNRAALRLVKTGGAHGSGEQQTVEILSGLAASDRVVIAPPAGLRDGQPLEVQP
jgi:RND family efflux transporter MFP subunit